MGKRIITFGTFDCLHPGHLNILKRSKEMGEYLVVGVSSDCLNKQKGKYSLLNQNERMEVIKSLKYVDEVFLEESLEHKNDYVKKYKADILVMGDDWSGKFDWCECETVYLPRTPNISTTDIKTRFEEMKNAKLINNSAIILDCWLYNFTYLIPKIETLNKFVNLKFKYLLCLNRGSEMQNNMLKHLNNKSVNTNNIEYVTMEDICQSDNKNLGMFTFSDEKSILLGHGYDEEECLSKLVISGYEEDYKWNRDFLLFSSFIADRDRDQKIFNSIYKIDPNKKTVVFCDNGLIPFLQNYDGNYQATVVDKLLDILISLKSEYNVVLRFHPMKEEGYYNSSLFPKKLSDNFIVDFTPFNIFFMFTVADIIIGSRITSSSLCSLFSRVRKIIFIDNNYDKISEDNYSKEITNSKMREWMDNGLLLSEKHLPIIGDWELEKINDIIKNDKFYLNNDKLQNFFLKRYNINRSEILDSVNSLLSYSIEKSNQFNLYEYIKKNFEKS